MKKKITKFSVLPVLGASVFFYSFSIKEAIEAREDLAAEFSTLNQELEFTVPDASEIIFLEDENRNYHELGKSYLAFREALGFKESGGDYKIINELGYMGKYQFGRGTLEMIGIRDTNFFLNNPGLQEAAFYANASRNKWILRRDIARFQDKVINGIKITESGILAAAHLAGPGNVKKFLRSNGAYSFNDAFGTSMKHYIKKFAGYDTSYVVPDRKAKAKIKNPSAV